MAQLGVRRVTVLLLYVALFALGVPVWWRTTEVYRAAEMFCTGTMGELASVTEVDGRTIGDGGIGPLTQRLSKLYAVETTEAGERILPARETA